MKKPKKIGFLTSGGDAPGMNAAIRAIVRSCAYYHIESIAIYEGYKGLIENKCESMNARSVANIINKGGTFLKSARSEKFRTYEGRQKAYQTCQKQNLDALVIIGGDGSFTGAIKLQEDFGIPCIGIPATIDNDIYGTDSTIGYDTALNTVVDAIDKIRDTATSHNRLFLIEVMGREAGFIALNAGIASGAEEILIPEITQSVEKLMTSLQNSSRAGKTSSIIVVSEGEKIGGVFELGRTVEENFPQYDVRISILGHIQRGGQPTCTDRVLASRMGVSAIETLISGVNNVMVGLIQQRIQTIPLIEAINKQKTVDPTLLKVAKIITV